MVWQPARFETYMEQIPKIHPEFSHEVFVDAVTRWSEVKAGEVLREGVPLTEDEAQLATAVGVEHPERVRILEVDAIPSPKDESIQAVARSHGFDFSAFKGLTLGHGILVVRGSRTRRLVAHELRHVHQYENAGSMAAFLETYITQLQAYGYQDAPLEVDARRYEQE